MTIRFNPAVSTQNNPSFGIWGRFLGRSEKAVNKIKPPRTFENMDDVVQAVKYQAKEGTYPALADRMIIFVKKNVNELKKTVTDKHKETLTELKKTYGGNVAVEVDSIVERLSLKLNIKQ